MGSSGISNKLNSADGWTIAITAFVVRLITAVIKGGLIHPELWEDDRIARAIITGQGFTFPAHHIIYYSQQPPLYAWLAVVSYFISGSLALLILVQIVAGSAIAVVAAAIAKRIFGTTAAALSAGILVAFHPGLIIYSATKAHPMTFDALFFVLTSWQVLRLRDRMTFHGWVKLGLIVGIGTLSRATVITFLPISMLWLLCVTRQSGWPTRWTVVRGILVASFVAVACLTPWTIRNYQIHHQFVFVQTTDGYDFWIGNNPNATGSAYINAGHSMDTSLTAEERADLESQPTELAQRTWFLTQARNFIYEHPGKFVRLALMKLFHFWWFSPQSGMRYPPIWFWLYAIYYAATFTLAAIGAWQLRHMGWEAKHNALLLAALLISLSILQSLYYVEGRHRWGVESLLLVISGGGVSALMGRWRQAD